MSDETETERTDRILHAQLSDRDRSNSRQPHQATGVKKPSVSRQASRPSQKTRPDKSSGTAQVGLLDLPLGGVRDVAIGVAYGLIPTVFAAILLPGALKLLAVVVLGIAGTVGYLLGAAPSR